jgi:hypothetical protein
MRLIDYVSQLFPNFGRQEINKAATQYAGLGMDIFQVNAALSWVNVSQTMTN